nr:hypothetical protein [Tanacetum cinerariifolium]
MSYSWCLHDLIAITASKEVVDILANEVLLDQRWRMGYKQMSLGRNNEGGKQGSRVNYHDMVDAFGYQSESFCQ